MEAFKEIGFAKAFKFIFYQFVAVILNLVFIPQIRVFFLRLLGAKIGTSCIIYNIKFMNLYRGGFNNLVIGNNCFIADEVLFDLAGSVKLGDNVSIANRVSILTHFNVGYKNHPLQKTYPSSISHVLIKNNVFIGVGVIILPSVIISDHVVVGAGSVVTKNIASHKVAVGSPARAIKSISV